MKMPLFHAQMKLVAQRKVNCADPPTRCMQEAFGLIPTPTLALLAVPIYILQFRVSCNIILKGVPVIARNFPWVTTAPPRLISIGQAFPEGLSSSEALANKDIALIMV